MKKHWDIWFWNVLLFSTLPNGQPRGVIVLLSLFEQHWSAYPELFDCLCFLVARISNWRPTSSWNVVSCWTFVHLCSMDFCTYMKYGCLFDVSSPESDMSEPETEDWLRVDFFLLPLILWNKDVLFCHVLFFLCWNCLSLFCSWFVVYNKKKSFFTFPLSYLVSISLSFQNELSKFPSADNIFNYEKISEICFVILSFKITLSFKIIRCVYDLFQTFGSLSHALHWEHKRLDFNLIFSKCFVT